ncbi:D-alanine--D-alanine ligase family protein [Prosthecochloris sp. HL-130-GSB]|jgi:D-alanine-D-alanine ligase|uniref:D-alanine--D-alanine ligase family protein n=1 Tax=Prosthecochloris sp. HL-130-GSB TaxID=1974213 RepID=UPI000A1C0879|nr:D-alanine--D-alanine ligase family protein [Prosthecochloris sp. HL-130-GSB]ARM30686.1 D-alanine--D-alanine ligase [Prosthecochloris sp. HL-130-GSB]
MPKRRVALIFGGKSTEHNISIISARAIAEHINRESNDVFPLYISREGQWFRNPTAEEILALDIPALLQKHSADEVEQNLASITRKHPEDSFSFDFRSEGIDVAFPVIHGSFGEDGRLQGLLDMLAIPYTGCDVTASAITMDKAVTKLCAEHAGIDIARFASIRRADFIHNPEAVDAMIEKDFDFPVFVKPASQGSSIGISKVHTIDQLQNALEKAFGVDTKALVEEMVSGREIEVAILGNEQPVVSVPGEIEPGNDFYDFTDKYIDGRAKLFIPARISDELSEKVRQDALTIYTALGCSGMSRVDFFVEERSKKVILNEVNTIPGFTSHSMYPRMMEASGIGFTALIERLLDLAFEKQHS